MHRGREAGWLALSGLAVCQLRGVWLGTARVGLPLGCSRWPPRCLRATNTTTGCRQPAPDIRLARVPPTPEILRTARCFSISSREHLPGRSWATFCILASVRLCSHSSSRPRRRESRALPVDGSMVNGPRQPRRASAGCGRERLSCSMTVRPAVSDLCPLNVSNRQLSFSCWTHCRRYHVPGPTRRDRPCEIASALASSHP